MITYQIEKLSDVHSQLNEYAVAQWNELRYHPIDEDLAPDVDTLLSMEKLGFLLLVTARDEGAVVGYVLLLCSDMLNHKGRYHATENAMYVDPAYRKQGIAGILVECSERLCKDSGVHYLSFSTTPTLDYSKLLEAKGFTRTEVLYTKRL